MILPKAFEVCGFYCTSCTMLLYISVSFEVLLFCDFRSRTAFERAKTDVFRIRTQNVGPLKKIRYVLLLIQIVF